MKMSTLLLRLALAVPAACMSLASAAAPEIGRAHV